MVPTPDRLRLDAAIPGLDAVPVIGILRGCPRSHAVAMVTAAVSAGLRVVEVTLDSEDALHQIADLIGAVEGVTVGVGTVVRPEQVDAAVDAGARFVVAPVTDPAVIARCVALGAPAVPGAATPTEIALAVRSGAAAVKVFPAAALGGPGYLTAVARPLGHPPLIPTGGVTWEDAPAYLRAGAVAVGAGSALFPQEALRRADADAVADAARRWIEAVA